MIADTLLSWCCTIKSFYNIFETNPFLENPNLHIHMDIYQDSLTYTYEKFLLVNEFYIQVPGNCLLKIVRNSFEGTSWFFIIYVIKWVFLYAGLGVIFFTTIKKDLFRMSFYQNARTRHLLIKYRSTWCENFIQIFLPIYKWTISYLM